MMMNIRDNSVIVGALRLIKDAWHRDPGKVVLLACGRVLVSLLDIAPYLILGAIVSSVIVESPNLTVVIGLIVLYSATWAGGRVVNGLLLRAYGRVEQHAQTDFIVARMGDADAAGAIARQTISDSELSFAIDNGAEGVRNSLHALHQALFGSLVNLVIGIGVIAVIAGPVTMLIFMAAAVVFIVTSIPLVREHQSRQRTSIEAAMKSFGVLQNTLSVWRDARMLGATDGLRDRYRIRRKPFETAILSTYRSTTKLSIVQAAIVYGSLAVMLAALVLMQGANRLDAGQIVAVIGVSLAALRPLESLGFGFSQLTVGVAQIQQTRETVERLRDAEEEVRPVAVTSRSGAGACLMGSDALTVTSLDGGHVLRVPALELTVGRPLWIVGRSGSGKTVLLEGLSGFAPAMGGSVTIGHPNGRRVPFMHISQRDVVLEDTVAFNISFGQQEEGDLVRVMIDCGLARTESDARERLKDAASGEGARLSGGETRRLLLGRALAADPVVIFCDEPTAGLDRTNRLLVWDRLMHESKRRIVIIATHDADAPIAADDSVIEVERLIVEPESTALTESRS